MFEFESQGAVEVVSAEIALTHENAEQLLTAITEKPFRGQPMVVLDMANVPLIDSAGLEALLDIQQKLRESAGSLAKLFKRKGSAAKGNKAVTRDPFDPSRPFTERMLEGWKRFDGDVLLLIGGRSLVAKEFEACVAASKEWQQVTGRDTVERVVMADADHKFSEPSSREALFDVLIRWLEDRLKHNTND